MRWLQQRRQSSRRVLTALGIAFFWAGLVNGQQLQQARVTQVVNDVKLLPTQAAPRPAVLNDAVTEGTAVRTGSDSRTELTFGDLTIRAEGSHGSSPPALQNSPSEIKRLRVQNLATPIR